MSIHDWSGRLENAASATANPDSSFNAKVLDELRTQSVSDSFVTKNDAVQLNKEERQALNKLEMGISSASIGTIQEALNSKVLEDKGSWAKVKHKLEHDLQNEHSLVNVGFHQDQSGRMTALDLIRLNFEPGDTRMPKEVISLQIPKHGDATATIKKGAIATSLSPTEAVKHFWSEDVPGVKD